MSLRGSIADFPLETIVQLLSATAKTGQLHLRSGDGAGTLAFDGGRLVGAASGDDVAEPALGAVFAIPSGDFEFVPSNEAPAANLSGDLEQLLDRAVVERDRIVRDREVIPNDRLRFALSERAAAQREITLSSDQWRTLLAVNGDRDLVAIAAQLRTGRLATLSLVAGLVRAGLLDALGPAPEPELAPEATPEPPAPATSGPPATAASELPSLEQRAAPTWQAAPSAPTWEAPAPARSWEQPAPETPSSEAPAPETPSASRETASPTAPSWEAAAPSSERPAAEAPTREAPRAEPAPTTWEPARAEPEFAQAGPPQEQTPTLAQRIAALDEAPPAEPAPAAPDERLSALSGLLGAATPASTTEPDARLAAFGAPSSAPPSAPTYTPDEISAVIPAGPSGAPVAPVSPKEEKRRGGLFGLFRKEQSPGPPVTTHLDRAAWSRGGQLAAFANTLLSEYNSGQYGKARVEERMASRLMRVDEQAEPIDRPLPVADDRIDLQALERAVLPAEQTGPYLAHLVTQIYADAEKTFGRDKAKKGYGVARQRVFGADTSALSDAEIASKLPKA